MSQRVLGNLGQLVGSYTRDDLRGRSRQELYNKFSLYAQRARYDYFQRLIGDISSFVSDIGATTNVNFYRGLNPNDNHGAIEILCLLPISFKGVTYRTPISVVLRNYPVNAPFFFVRSDENMRFNPACTYINSSGMALHEYIDHWTMNSSLAELTAYISSVFSAYPPLVKVKKELSVSTVTSSINQIGNNAMNSFSQAVLGKNIVGGDSDHQINAPAASSVPYVNTTNSAGNKNFHTPNTNTANSGSNPNSQFQHNFKPNNQPTPSITPSHTPPYTDVDKSLPPPSYEESEHQDDLDFPSDSISHSHSHSHSYHEDTSAETASETTNKGNRVDLEDLVFVKMDSKANATLTDLTVQKTELQKKKEELQLKLAEKKNLLASRDSTNASTSKLYETMSKENNDLSEWVRAYSERELEIFTQDTKQAQILDAVSEDKAIDEALEVLRGMLKQKRIGIDVYMSQVRTLSMKQFEVRALSLKAV